MSSSPAQNQTEQYHLGPSRHLPCGWCGRINRRGVFDYGICDGSIRYGICHEGVYDCLSLHLRDAVTLPGFRNRQLGVLFHSRQLGTHALHCDDIRRQVAEYLAQPKKSRAAQTYRPQADWVLADYGPWATMVHEVPPSPTTAPPPLGGSSSQSVNPWATMVQHHNSSHSALSAMLGGKGKGKFDGKGKGEFNGKGKGKCKGKGKGKNKGNFDGKGKGKNSNGFKGMDKCEGKGKGKDRSRTG
jgi:hypothetical protein